MELLATSVTLLFALYYTLALLESIPTQGSGSTIKLIVKLVLIAIWVYWWLRLAGYFPILSR